MGRLFNVRQTGFTLIETVVVLAIITVVLGLLLAAMQRARDSAVQLQCRDNLRQLVQASHAFHDRHKRLPPSFGFLSKGNIYNGDALGPLFFHLLPDVGRQDLWKRSRDRPKSSPQQDFYLYTANEVHRQSVPAYNCPADPTLIEGVNRKTEYAASSYAGNHLVFGRVDEHFRHVGADGRATLAATFHDGTAHTILFAEKYAVSEIRATDHPQGRSYQGGCHWAYFQADCNNPLFAYYHPKRTDPNSVGPKDESDPRDSRFGVRTSASRTNPCLPATGHFAMNVGMADGSVRQLARGMDRFAWWALVTPRGGEAR